VDDHISHSRTEFAFDVFQASKGRYASEGYKDYNWRTCIRRRTHARANALDCRLSHCADRNCLGERRSGDALKGVELNMAADETR
jgi:hypothetical protein